MDAIHNVVAVSATVGYLGKEGMVIRKTIIPTIYYIIVFGLMGMVTMQGWVSVIQMDDIFSNDP